MTGHDRLCLVAGGYDVFAIDSDSTKEVFSASRAFIIRAIFLRKSVRGKDRFPSL